MTTTRTSSRHVTTPVCNGGLPGIYCTTSTTTSPDLMRKIKLSGHTFSAFFHSKIQSIKANIASKIALSSLTPPQVDLPFTGTPLTSFPPITHNSASGPSIHRHPSDLISTNHPQRSSLLFLKSSTMDFIPTSLIKSCSSVFTEIYHHSR